MSRTDFYAVLGVSRDATTKQLKDRFRVLVRERHPDRFRGEEKARAESEFQAITEAFNILTDSSRRRQHDEELRQPAKAVKHDPLQAAKLFISRGIKAYREGSYLDAASNFNRAVEIDPHNVQAWFQLARTASHEERWLPKAREAIDRATDLAPKEASYAIWAGRIYEKSGRRREARDHFRRALKLGSSDPTVREALERLGGTPKRESGSPEKPRRPGLWGKILS